MKKIIIGILFLIFLIGTQSAFSQRIRKEERDPDRYVYWFYIKAEIKKSRIHHKPVYVVRRLGNTLKSGTIKKYENDLWRYLNRGNQLAIGPFSQYNDAKRAIKMYDLARKTDEIMKKEIDEFTDSTATPGDYYFYYLKFKVSKRTRAYILDHKAAHVSFGDLKRFKTVLWEGLTFEKLAIGPFPSQPEAEESKLIYRSEER